MSLAITIETNPHGHFDGRDFVVAKRPFNCDVFCDKEVDIFVMHQNNVVGEDIVTWERRDTNVVFMFNAPLQRVKIYATGEGGRTNAVMSYEFDVVSTVSFTNDLSVTNRGIAQIYRQNINLQENVRLLQLMYHKVCELLVQMDRAAHDGAKRKRGSQ